MTRQTINIGSTANDGTGDPLRTAFDKINDNFVELYGSDSDATTFTNPTLVGATMTANLDLNGNKIISATNGSITLDPNGTGTIELVGATNITGTTTVSSTLNVTGGTTLSSLVLSSGSTISSFIDDDTLSTATNSNVPTAESVKAYVDAQNVAQALTFVGDDSTGTAVNSGETFRVAGGTGLDTAVSGDTLTVSIDSTVATLTGSQTLTNKTLTSPTITSPTVGGNLTSQGTIYTDSISATGSNADLLITAQGTGTVNLGANLVGGANTISSSAFDINGGNIDNTQIGFSTPNTGFFTTLNSSVSFTGGQVYIAGNEVTTNQSNADLELSANGSGQIKFKSPVDFVGQSITVGRLNADNISIDSSTISSTNTNGGINITPDGSGIVSIGGTEMQTTKVSAKEFETDQILISGNNISTYESNADINLIPAGTGGVQISGKLGLFGASPVAQQSAIAFDPLANDGSTVDDLRQVINQMLVVLRNYGIIAS
jgi:hypothetical protein